MIVDAVVIVCQDVSKRNNVPVIVNLPKNLPIFAANATQRFTEDLELPLDTASQ